MTAAHDRMDLDELEGRELIDGDELELINALSARPRADAAWNPVRHRMTVSGDVARWRRDLEVRVRRDGMALVEWQGPAPLPHQLIEQLCWAFGRPRTIPPGPSLVSAVVAGAAAGAVVLVRGNAVWRNLRRRMSPGALEAAAAPDALVIQLGGWRVYAPLLPRLSGNQRGVHLPTACARVFAAPGVAPVFRAVAEVVTDPDVQLCIAVEPGQLLVVDALSWRVGRSAASLRRIDFASPSLVGLGLGFKVA
ncbi:MAG TPA: hypothetical protein VFU21_20730 [Kofleriaceae bacterium]|nr:hypothetical protein [Kofleriaceae bacterium]